MGVICCHFLRPTSPEMGSTFKASGVNRHQGEERDLTIIAPLAAEGELIRSPLNRIAVAGHIAGAQGEAM